MLCQAFSFPGDGHALVVLFDHHCRQYVASLIVCLDDDRALFLLAGCWDKVLYFPLHKLR
jgi:hypothetical protein